MGAERGKSNDIIAEVCPPDPLTVEEKAILTPHLERRGLNPVLLDIITNIPHRTRLVKARSSSGELLGLTSILLTPSIFMKHCFGQGNHIGTNTTFFFAKTDRKRDVLAAIFQALVELRPFGYYIGLVDDDLAGEFRSALSDVPHIVADRVMEAGSLSTRDPAAEKRLFRRHRHLSRQVHRFRNKGGTIHIDDGPMSADLADDFVACCLASYRHNIHPVSGIDIDRYGEHVHGFLTSFPDTVTMYASLQDRVVGVQSFIRHRNHLELTEGGFLTRTYHAYENIMVSSVRYGVENGLDRVGYGLVLNRPKDRLLDTETRTPVYLIMFFDHLPEESEIAICRRSAHERFPTMPWRERNSFPTPPPL